MISVTAKNFLKKGCLDEIMPLYKKLVDATRNEEGCIKYELHQDSNNPSILTMIEEWENEGALEKHLESEHFTTIVPMFDKYREKETELNIYQKLL